MKLKFINLLLASALLVGSAQVFTSCKDNEADIWNNLKQENLTLQELVNQHIEDFEGLKDRVKVLEDAQVTQEDIDNAIAAALEGTVDINDVTTAITTALANYATTTEVSNMISTALNGLNIPADLTERVVALEQAKAGIISRLETLEALPEELATLTGTVNGHTTDINDLKAWKGTVTETILPELTKKAEDAMAKANANENEIKALKAIVEKLKSCECDPTKIEGLGNKVEDLENRVKALEDKVTTLEGDVKTLREEAATNLKAAKDYADNLNKEVKKEIDTTNATVKEVQDAVTKVEESVKDVKETLTTKIENNATDIENIRTDLGKLLNRVEYLENRVTSVIMQEVDNNIYGSLLTPFGISSNVLIAYAGNTAVERDFPSMEAEYDGECPLTAADLQILQQCGLQLTTIPMGTIINQKDNNLGKVYFTVNPGNINLKGKTFNLVNSLGETQGIELRNVQESFYKIEHGYDASRSITNGFYEADAYIAPNNVGNINFTINEGLKAAVKEVLKAGRDNNRNTVATLAKALYQQVDGIVPAYALSASWAEDGKTYTTTGQYNMAVATVRPLSFTTLTTGLPFKKRLPDLGTLIDKVVDRFHFDISGDKYKITIDKTFKVSSIDIQIRNVNIVIADMDVNVNVSAPVQATAYLNFDVETESGEVIHIEQEVPVSGQANTTAHTTIDMSQLQADLNAQLNKVLQNTGQDIQDAVDQLVNNISSEVVDLLTSLESQVNTTIDQVVADMNSLINSKVNGLVDRIENTRVYDLANRAIGRINMILDDPNHYLQVALFYKNDKGFGLMSSLKNRPTVINGNGNGMLLVPTTLSAEIVCPAYEKFVAVTNVWKGNASAQDGDADCLKVLKDSNAQKYLCSVLPGTQMTAPLAYTKGYTYEITYQAVDYTGRTSTQKYYVIFK